MARTGFKIVTPRQRRRLSGTSAGKAFAAAKTGLPTHCDHIVDCVCRDTAHCLQFARAKLSLNSCQSRKTRHSRRRSPRTPRAVEPFANLRLVQVQHAACRRVGCPCAVEHRPSGGSCVDPPRPFWKQSPPSPRASQTAHALRWSITAGAVRIGASADNRMTARAF